MPILIALLVLAWVADPAAAHGVSLIEPRLFWRIWSFDPWVIGPLLLAHWLYGRGVLRLWARAGRGRGIGWRHIATFIAGEIILIIALLSPLDQLAGTLVSAHMLQHGLLVIAAPPLLLLARPGAAFAWSLPGAAQHPTIFMAWRSLSRLGRLLSRPLPALILHGVTLWIWHAPPLFEAALRNERLHALEHLMFFATALLFWQALLAAHRSSAIGPALAITFLTLIHTGLLGALLTFAPSPLYDWYDGRTEFWGLSPLEDQQLAGLIMWVPMGLVYIGAALVLAGRVLGGEATPKRSVRPTPS
jgi:putative membrane protein